MTREHPLAPHRIVPVAVILLLGFVALLALKGPDWYQRFYHPLRYEDSVNGRSRQNGLDPFLVAALINVESEFDADQVSPKGAVGLMQLLPTTAVEVARAHGIPGTPDSEDLKDPDRNIQIGTRHLADLMERYAVPEEALAAYNAGSGSADRWRRTAAATRRPFVDVIEYPETRRYIDDVLEQRDAYARLYPGVFDKVVK